MKHASKLAFLAAAGMATAGAQAADFEIAEGTTLTLGGEVVLNYLYEKYDNGDNDTKFVDDGSLVILGGSHDLGNGITAYVETEFEYNALGNNDDVKRDASILGFTGEFGEFAVGASDNVFEDLISDAVDPFENATLDQVSLTDEDSMVTYYSPDMDGFSFRLQGRHNNRGKGESAEISLIGAAEYDFGPVAVAAAYDSRGSVNSGDNEFKSQDHVVGLAITGQLTERLEASARFAQENDQAGNDKDFTAIAMVYNYGGGDLYGAAQNYDPSGGDSSTQVAAGINYDIADSLMIFAEYGDLDRKLTDGDIVDADTNKLGVAGLVYEF
ncbi:porin [Spiribacter insolitus]|uniref:Porin n=1 Tax=Spiribacter insolitus TaxID=3122417 RepID=A0ABV3T782_9GAMM